MPRVDKYDPIDGGFRADVSADVLDSDIGKLYGYGLNSLGQAVKGAGQSGIMGVWVFNDKPGRVGPLREVSRQDIMRMGCITDFCATAGVPGTDTGVAATAYYSDATGVISSTKASGSYYVGACVEPNRLEVNFNPVPLP
jgi:hypothetical protein